LKELLILLSLISFAYVCGAQVTDDFSDGDYTASPVWTPDDTNNWTVVSNQLRSNSAIANTSFYITTPSAKATNAQWEFFVQLQFNTSSSNLVDVYLISEQQNLQATGNNGYFVRIGGTPDEISLYKVVNGMSTILINGADGVTNRTNNLLRIKVTRDANNLWTLERDANGGTNYISEGSVTDNSITTSSFFGFRVVQSTSTFFNRHFFDDIYVGEIILDGEPPLLQSVQVLSDIQVSLVFNEVVEINTAQTLINYTASGTLGNPQQAELLADGKTVTLTFAQPFVNGTSYTLNVQGVQDLAGNLIVPISVPFLYFQSGPISNKDIIITEIMADPTPQVGLPEAEFIEIYNRSSSPIDLAGWKFTDGSSTATLPSQIILSGQYWILCSNASAPLFTSFGNVLPLANFPTLNNAGEAIMLRTSTNQTIDSINYSIAWYKDDDKKEGGWTLELIDLNNPCGESDNWVASEDIKGGTPGKINSVNANKPDLTGPTFISVTTISSTELRLLFDEKLERHLSQVTFLISPEVAISKAAFTNLMLREITLTLSQALSPRQLYELEVKNLRDCNGNFIKPEFSKLKFALPESVAVGDVFINEVLFNPKSGGVDFVEVFNQSDKYLNIKNWVLANRPEEQVINPRVIAPQDYILPPAGYLVFTSSIATLLNYHLNAISSNLFQTTLPSMNDDSGSIALVSDQGLLLDYFRYDQNYHSRLLKDKEGVSLERISVKEDSNNPANWKSASSASGFATPGFINSNTRPDFAADENAVVIEPEIFSPAVPGQDFAQINFRFDQPGLLANVKIADQQGRVIKEIANNETLGFEGFFRWDGDRSDGSKARMGYYFVWFEVYDLSGMLKTYRKRVVIGK
jgi:hypothetical protein